ncbi:MAG: NADP-dependent malic enzyme [Candidatus Thermoplasmatota archaeon]|jgi:malate dehydrogenase (oxaloacetate-decarboxylating)|nr:NADP-dependent malic enzyme [Candidatus Thermoplasmatota archaeon]
MNKINEKKLIEKANKPGKEAIKLHPFYRGKIEIIPKCCIRDFNDFAIWYTPGVAEPCKEIQKNPLKVYDYTNKWNTVAVVSDGTRVLGLGDIGPEAGLPVMEGKSLLFKYLGGVDAYPICLDTKNPDEIIQVVKWLKPSFGGINLEDIEKPKCFYILDKLRKEMDIPVWHDDQQGTATIVTAGVINALKIVNKKMENVLVSMIGAGSANVAIARMLIAAGVKQKNIIMVDSKGILNPQRKDLEKEKKVNPEKWTMCLKSNKECRSGSAEDAIKDTDICIAASKPGPGTIKKQWISKMAQDSIVFATANPIPEIWPWEAKEAGARIVATGRSDFPNQINNSLGFPGIFRGTLDVRAKTITDEMCIAAAYEIAKTAEDKRLNDEYIVPTMDCWEVFPREAVAVGLKAISQKIARIKPSKQELYEHAMSIIKKARNETNILMKKGFIINPP